MDDWRSGVAGRRAIAVKVVLEATAPGKFIEPILRQLKQDIGYHRLERADQRLFITMASQLRRICENWHRLDDTTKLRFENGFLPYSAVCKRITEAGG